MTFSSRPFHVRIRKVFESNFAISFNLLGGFFCITVVIVVTKSLAAKSFVPTAEPKLNICALCRRFHQSLAVAAKLIPQLQSPNGLYYMLLRSCLALACLMSIILHRQFRPGFPGPMQPAASLLLQKTKTNLLPMLLHPLPRRKAPTIN